MARAETWIHPKRIIIHEFVSKGSVKQITNLHVEN